jgi:hypothetical protein
MLLGSASAALATGEHCTTYRERTLNHLQSLWNNGTCATSIGNRTLGRWETMITESSLRLLYG